MKINTSPVKLLIQRFITPTLRPTAIIAAALALSFGSAQAQRPLGVDVSNNNGGGINWGGVKGAGFTYGWAKATEGTYFIDPDFAQNENNGKGAGVVMGAYDFSRPDLSYPATEAAYFWAEAGGYINADGLTLQPALDIETFNGVYGGGTYSQWVNNWCNDIKNYANLKGVGVTPFIYTTTCEACNFDTSVSQWLSWIANPNGESSQTGTPWTACTSCEVWGSGSWNAWQYLLAQQRRHHRELHGSRLTLRRALVVPSIHHHPTFPGQPHGHGRHTFRPGILDRGFGRRCLFFR